MAPGKSPGLFPELGGRQEKISLLAYETRFREMGFLRIAGVDEAGRGPLAGPVIAAAVVLPREIPPKSPLLKVRDSKLLTQKKRGELYHVIEELADDVAWAMCDPAEIDAMNILAASLEAMRQAVNWLDPRPELCLIDGNQTPSGIPPARAIVKGDRRCLSIAAASIVAKVVRDRIMDELHRLHPAYGFHLHKGYPTAEHKAAIARFGPCPVHRRTYRGVREFCETGGAE